MNPITDYTDYRTFVRDFYSERKALSCFSWREFARIAGFASGSYLKLVCDGKTRLTIEGASRTADAMGLSDFEKKYFLLMVNYNDAKDRDKRRNAFEKMIALGMERKSLLGDDNSLSHISSWKNVMLRELAPMMPNASFSEMAEQCYSRIDSTEVEESLRTLRDNDLLVVDNEGCYHLIDRENNSSSRGTVLESEQSVHRQMAELAIDALKDLPQSERNFSGLTVGVTSDSFGKILRELAELQRKVVDIASSDKDVERVYQLNLQLFPLTKALTSAQQGRNGKKSGGATEDSLRQMKKE